MRIVAFGCSNTYGQGLVDCHINGGPGPRPSMFAWPQLVADNLGYKIDNKGVPGASNLEILANILKYDFKQDDVVLIMWATTDRDYIFGHKPLQIGAWQSSDIVRDWINVHSEEDLVVRSWIYFHHAILHLQSKNLKFFNFFSYTKGFNLYKPDWITADIYDINVNKDDLALDNLHMGPISHRNVADRVRRIMNEH